MREVSELADWLQKQIQDNHWTQRVAAEEIKISKTALHNILNNPEMVPELETLGKLSARFKVPLWRLVEMCGFNSGLFDPSDRARRVAALIDAQPEYARLADELLALTPDDFEGTIRYLEGQRLRREQQQ